MSKLITDLEQIKKLSKKKADENWEFRAYLKWIPFTFEKLDSIVHPIYERVNAQIDCTQCGNCCRTTTSNLSEHDIKRAAKGLGISPERFIEQYLTQEENEWELPTVPCPFLSDNLCTIYEYRFECCRSFPHLHKKAFSTRTIAVIDNCEICPIVFNVWELLKGELWRRRYHRILDDEFD